MKYNDNDVLWLALNNEGYQFDRFVHRLYKKGNINNRYHLLILNFFKEYKLETSIDLFTHLQNPNMVNWVTKKEYEEVTGKEAVSKKMFTYEWDEEKSDWILTPSNTVTSNYRFPIYSNFNWGNVKGKAAMSNQTDIFRGNRMKIGDSYLEDGIKKFYGEKKPELKVYPDMKYIEYYSNWENII